jgi:hypothetical protein
MEVRVVARSIGRPTAAHPLSMEGHAGVVLNLGVAGANDHWIVQGGPSSGWLRGWLIHATQGWLPTFAKTRGAIWNKPNTVVELPVFVVRIYFISAIDLHRIKTIVTELNQLRMPYNYSTGPNSNTYVKMFLQRLGVKVSSSPGGPLMLKGWLRPLRT